MLPFVPATTLQRRAAAVASPRVPIATGAYLLLTLVPDCLITSAQELLESKDHGTLHAPGPGSISDMNKN